LQKPNFIADDA